MLRSAHLLVAAVLLGGCVSATSIPDDQRDQLDHELKAKSRFLKVSLYKAPFWRDDSKVLVSDVDPTTLQYLTDTDGKVIATGAATGVVPVGKHVRIAKVEFPTAMTVAGRMVYSPRYNPWIYLEIEGEDQARPEVLVLRSGLKSRDEFLAVLERYLSVDDPTPTLTAYPDEVRTAIREKRVVKDMDATAVEMAWGYPDHKRIDLKDGHRFEAWSYANGQRQVELTDNKLTDSKQGVSSTANP